MTQTGAGNPYQAPETATAALRAELRRPPVYTAISLFCWVLGGIGFLMTGALGYYISTQIGWTRIATTPEASARILWFASLTLFGTFAYLSAGRLLWLGRDRPGLLVCVLGIGLTYGAVWVYSSMPSRPPRRIDDPQIFTTASKPIPRSFPLDHA